MDAREKNLWDFPAMTLSLLKMLWQCTEKKKKWLQHLRGVTHGHEAEEIMWLFRSTEKQFQNVKGIMMVAILVFIKSPAAFMLFFFHLFVLGGGF